MALVPAEYDLIDIHSHITDSEDNVFRILNTSTLDFTPIRSTGPVSVGLHPWHIKDEAIETLHTKLETALKSPNVLAVGETGLDRIIKTDLDIQEEIFRIHIHYAIEYRKPLIIHCVKAYPELIRLKNQFGSEISWIIHGFNGNAEIAKELVSKGFYISIGSSLLRNKEKAQKIRGVISTQYIFIETDEYKIPVRELYSNVADLFNTDTSSLHKIIKENYFKAFNH